MRPRRDLQHLRVVGEHKSSDTHGSRYNVSMRACSKFGLEGAAIDFVEIHRMELNSVFGFFRNGMTRT